MKRFTVIYERDSTGRWSARIKEAPAVLTQGRTLTEARRRIRAALEFALGSNRAAKQSALIDDIRLPSSARRAIHALAVARARLEQSRQGVSDATEAAIAELLRRMKLSVRDTGELLGLSHQRIQQLRRALRGGGTARNGPPRAGSRRPDAYR